jgi:lysozyme
MEPSKDCYNLIKSFEAFRPTAYLPTPHDVWTIGWGHTHAVHEGMTCTVDQGEEWLRADMLEAVHIVNVNVRVPLRQHQFDALVSLAFNVEAAVGRHSQLLQALNHGDYKAAQHHFADWCHQGKRKLAGLVTRRHAEAALFGSA